MTLSPNPNSNSNQEAWNKWKVDPEFKAELATIRREFIGGPT